MSGPATDMPKEKRTYIICSATNELHSKSLKKRLV
jgi:hypothetical protein